MSCLQTITMGFVFHNVYFKVFKYVSKFGRVTGFMSMTVFELNGIKHIVKSINTKMITFKL